MKFYFCNYSSISVAVFRASGRSRKKSQISRDFQGQIRGKKWPISREIPGIFEASFVEKWLVKNGRFRGSFPSKFRWKAIGFALIWGTFSMKLDALIAFTQASYRTLQVSLLNMINKRIRILKIPLPSNLLRRVSSLSNCTLFASPSKFCLWRFFIFSTSEARFSALYSLFFKSVVTMLL